MAFAATTVFAQDLTSKKGEPILPEADDWSIGVDATPFLNYAGNLFNGNSFNNAPTWNFLNTNQTIIGKMFMDEKTAYRAILRIGFQSTKEVAMIADATVTTPPTYPNLPSMKEDTWKHSQRFIGLGGGIEMRRGKTRLQGFYGGDFMFWMSGSKDVYEYGNALSASGTVVTPNPGTTTSFNGGANMTFDTYGNAARVTEYKSGSTIGFGVRGFIGAEYFILPKISVGAEFGWGFGITTTGADSETVESVGGTGPSVGTQTVEGGKASSMMLDVDRNAFGTGNGSLRMNFHF